MSAESVARLAEFSAPYGREVVLQDVTHESGLRMLRVRIREGHRFTIMDVDAATAAQFGRAMCDWAEAAAPSDS
jgi:hypothetical protein